MRKLLIVLSILILGLIALNCENIFMSWHEVGDTNDLEDLVKEGEYWLDGKNNGYALTAFDKATSVIDKRLDDLFTQIQSIAENDSLSVEEKRNQIQDLLNESDLPSQKTLDLAIRAHKGKLSAKLNLCATGGIFFTEILSLMGDVIRYSEQGEESLEGNNDFLDVDPFKTNPSTKEVDHEYALSRWSCLLDSTNVALESFRILFDYIQFLNFNPEEDWNYRFTNIGIEETLVSSIQFMSNAMVTVYQNLDLLDQYGLTIEPDFSNIDEIEQTLRDNGHDIDLANEQVLVDTLNDMGLVEGVDYSLDPESGMPVDVVTDGVDTYGNPIGDSVLGAISGITEDEA